MVTYLDTAEEYSYKDHEITIEQEHYGGDKHLTFKAVVDGEHYFTVYDYAHDHEGLLGFFTLNMFRKCSTQTTKSNESKN